MDRIFNFIYRIYFAVFIWSTILTGLLLGGVVSFIGSLKYYTMQTNLMVAIWFTLAIIWHNNPKALQKISGKIKGAVTLYITVTFLVFAIVLSPLYHPTGFAFFSNLVLHYIAPIAFIIDWILTETEVKYEWKFLLYWFIYPICYLCFAITFGTFTGDYLYPFLDITALGVPFFILCLAVLVGLFVALSSVFVAINRKWIYKKN
jgi:hypothetical protein